MSPPKGEGLLFRDSVDVQPPDLETEETKASDANPYHKVLPPKFLACPKADPWAPVAVVEEEGRSLMCRPFSGRLSAD